MPIYTIVFKPLQLPNDLSYLRAPPELRFLFFQNVHIITSWRHKYDRLFNFSRVPFAFGRCDTFNIKALR